MLKLERTMVDKFKIENSIKLEEILLKKDNIITIEQYFLDACKIELNDKKIELFLNGVNLTYNLSDGIYRIYNKDNNFIGLGVIENKLLKRDIIIN